MRFTSRVRSLTRHSRSRFGRLASSSAIVGTRTMLQWPRSPRSHPKNPRGSIGPTRMRPRKLGNRAAANYRFLNGSPGSAVCPHRSSRVTKSRSSINVMGALGVDVVILLSSAWIGISLKSSALRRVADAFRRHCSDDRVHETGPAPASADLGSFGAEWHALSVSWFVGGTDPDRYAKAKQAGRLDEIRPTTICALRRLSIRPCRPASRR